MPDKLIPTSGPRLSFSTHGNVIVICSNRFNSSKVFADPEAGRSKQAPFPFTREITVDVIASAGDKLWKELVGNDTKMNLTHVALSFTGIDVTEAGQQSIEAFLKSGKNDKRPRETDGLGVGSIEQGYGELSSQDFPSTSYTCAKCGKKLTVFLDSDVMDGSDPLEMLRTEHEDFHFAQELAKDWAQESKLRDSSPKKGTAPKSAKRRRVESKGIEKFLLRK